MKVRVTNKAYYNNELLKEGRIIDYKGKKLPSWATLADGIETNKGNKAPKGPEAKEPNENKEPNDTEKGYYLDLLLDEAVEKNIVIENIETKTIDEQIAELEMKLGKEK